MLLHTRFFVHETLVVSQPYVNFIVFTVIFYSTNCESAAGVMSTTTTTGNASTEKR